MRTFVLFLCLLSFVGLNGQDKNYIGGLRGTDSLSISRVWVASLVLPGYAQAYNKQYWKIPALYVGTASMIYGGSRTHKLYQETGNNTYLNQSRLLYAGAGLMYVGSVLDGLLNYQTNEKILPRKATLLSLMVPGMGQAYNGDYWKIPLIYSGFTFLGYWYDLNQMQYNRYRNAYNIESLYEQDNSQPKSEFHGRLSKEGIRNNRNRFRRDRDYAVLYIALWYGLNIIDANVWAHLSNFDISDDLAFRVAPNLTLPAGPSQSPAVGFTITMNLK